MKTPFEPNEKVHFYASTITRPSLLEEWVEYGNKKKAEIVYRKCMAAGKTTIAGKIKQKYRLVLYPVSDRAIEISLLLRPWEAYPPLTRK